MFLFIPARILLNNKLQKIPNMANVDFLQYTVENKVKYINEIQQAASEQWSKVTVK